MLVERTASHANYHVNSPAKCVHTFRVSNYMQVCMCVCVCVRACVCWWRLAMVSYNVIIGDTITKIAVRISGRKYGPTSLSFASCLLVLLVIVLVFIYFSVAILRFMLSRIFADCYVMSVVLKAVKSL